MKKNLKKSKKGFTLIELVVVIAILGILAAILVPVISGFIETANQSADNANARLVYQAAAMWFASKNPGADTTLTVTTAGTGETDINAYLGLNAWPTAKSKAFAGTFAASVKADGAIVVVTQTGSTVKATYDPATGKLS